MGLTAVLEIDTCHLQLVVSDARSSCRRAVEEQVEQVEQVEVEVEVLGLKHDASGNVQSAFHFNKKMNKTYKTYYL